MRQETVDILTIDELSDSAKAAAIEDYRINGFNYEWWDSVYEDAKAIGSILGITIDKIWFSGFSCQGDGACFDGSYKYEPGSVKKLKDYAPKDKRLHQIAVDLSKAQRPAFYHLYATVKQSGRCMHDGCTQIDVTNLESQYPNDVSEEWHDGISEALRDFMKWIYRTLETEWDWQSADEQIAETIECNEYEYTADGEMYRRIKAAA